MDGASTPIPDAHFEDVNDNDSVAPDAPFTDFTLPSSLESDATSLSSQSPLRYSSSDGTQSHQEDDASAAAQWDPLPHSPVIASPRVIRASSRHFPQPNDCYRETASCHRCKRRPVRGTLLACISPRCTLKFCTTCLNRYHVGWAETIMPAGRIHCPRCLQVCTCKTCNNRSTRQLGRSVSSQQQLAHSGTTASVLSLSPHSPITQSQSPQVVIPLELYELLVQTATQPVGVQPHPLL
jgi:hypothetical protein